MGLMQDPHIESLDLRSLRFLARLIETGSVTRAGEACGLSQPTASRVLARLRDALGDPLLVRGQQKHVLTSRAEALRDAVREAEEAVALLLARGDFDPAVTERTFRMGATEYSMATVVSGLLQRIQAAAPRSLVRFLPVGPATLDALEAGDLDLTFWPFEAPEEPFVSVDLFWEHLVGVVCAEHPIARLATEGAVPLDAYVAHPHILLAPGSPGPNPVDGALGALGLSRRVAFTTAQFSTVWALRGTDLVMNVPSRLATLTRDHGLVAFPLPVQVPAFACRLVWHRRSEGDPGLTWLRDLVRSELMSQSEGPL